MALITRTAIAHSIRSAAPNVAAEYDAAGLFERLVDEKVDEIAAAFDAAYSNLITSRRVLAIADLRGRISALNEVRALAQRLAIEQAFEFPP